MACLYNTQQNFQFIFMYHWLELLLLRDSFHVDLFSNKHSTHSMFYITQNIQFFQSNIKNIHIKICKEQLWHLRTSRRNKTRPKYKCRWNRTHNERNTTYFVFYCLYLSIWKSNKSLGYFPYIQTCSFDFYEKEENRNTTRMCVALDSDTVSNPTRQGTLWKMYKYLTGKKIFLVL